MSMSWGGVLFLRRVQWQGTVESVRRLPRWLSEADLRDTYRGIDGEPWPTDIDTALPHEDGLAPLTYWNDALSLTRAAGRESFCDCVILSDSARGGPLYVPLLGFDVGFYAGEDSVFSSIIHESLHGHIPELRGAASKLNGALLFPSEAEAARYVEVRENCRHRGQDVESSECRTIAILGMPDSAEP